MATRAFFFLTSAQVQRLHMLYITKNPNLQQPNLLESAVHSPTNQRHYGNQQDVFQLAANLSEKIMKNHAYMDGNKRTALVAADIFLKMNGYVLQDIPFAQNNVNMDLANAHVAVVTNRWSTEDLGQFYRSVAAQLG
ncbi:MAG: hypothetical protein Q9160_004054 [Pyrenula sp. 1 TL-2023]